MIPFRAGMRVTGRDFCGRQEELAQLRAYMQSSGRVYVVGERRIGKTSLIYESLRPLKKLRRICVDLLAVKTLADVTHRFSQALVDSEKRQAGVINLLKQLGSIRPAVSLDPGSGMPTLTFTPGAGNRLETLDEIFAVLGRLAPFVVVFDEFQDILALSEQDQVVARLRTLIQHCEQGAFVFCGSVRSAMESLFTDRESPFFNSAMRLSVGPLDQSTFRDFLKRKFRAGNRRVPNALLTDILNSCNDNPGDVQRFCTALWQVTSGAREVDKADLDKAWIALLAMQRDAYELILLELSSQQDHVLRALAHAGGESLLSKQFLETTGISLAASARKAMTKLVSKRLVQKIGTAYRFCDPFFAAWLRRQPI